MKMRSTKVKKPIDENKTNMKTGSWFTVKGTQFTITGDQATKLKEIR